MGLSFVLLSAGLLFSIYAEYIWLQMVLPTHLAALMTSLTLFLLSVLAGFVGGVFKNRKEIPSDSSSAADISTLLGNVLSSFDEDVEEVIRANPKIVVALSTLAGFVAGKKLDS